MKRNEIYRFMRIEHEDGTIVELPFLEIDQQLWSRDGLRLMLLLDPGRIKRGLKPREEIGPILEEGKTFRLVIESDWLDSDGNSLVAKTDGHAFVKEFSVGPPDGTQPNPMNWKLNSPTAQSKAPLKITLDEPCDSALLKRLMQVTSADPDQDPDLELEGTWSLGEDESSVDFTPNIAWQSGDYLLMIRGELEDLCGNSVERQFDVDLFEKTEPSDSTPTTVLEFSVNK